MFPGNPVAPSQGLHHVTDHFSIGEASRRFELSQVHDEYEGPQTHT